MNPRALNLLLALARAGVVGDVLLAMAQEDADALRAAHIAVCRSVRTSQRKHWRLVEWLGQPTWLATEGAAEQPLFVVRHRAPSPPSPPTLKEGDIFREHAHLGLPVRYLVQVPLDDEDHGAEGRVVPRAVLDVPPPGYPLTGTSVEPRRNIEAAWCETDRLPMTQANRDWGERRRAQVEEAIESRAMFPFRRRA